MRFRPCIDLRDGDVVQIVGATLESDGDVRTNYTAPADLPAAYFAELYCRDGLDGGHVIMLGRGSENAAAAALSAYPHGLYVGGGITTDNATTWLDRGAACVIVTSYIFADGHLHRDRLEALSALVGAKRLVLDLSCTRHEGRYVVAADRWKTLTDFEVNEENLRFLATNCTEFLVHATQMEGRQEGIDTKLVDLLARISPLPTTYAGGIRNMDDIVTLEECGAGRLDFTVGSALDIFGGSGVLYEELVQKYGG